MTTLHRSYINMTGGFYHDSLGYTHKLLPGQSSLSDDMYNNNQAKETQKKETVSHSYSSGANELTYLLNLQDMQIENGNKDNNIE